MYCTVIIARYPKHLGLFGFFSMLLFRIPFWFSKTHKFWKLMGSGKNGTFDIHPDFRQWAILYVNEEKISSIPSFIKSYLNVFHCEIKQLIMEPLEGHGFWDGKQIFGALPGTSNYNGSLAVLTRATIRLRSLRSFWKNVPRVAGILNRTAGLVISYGIGELPFIKQATLSIWTDKASMKAFAYNMQEHSDVIRKTRNQNWYSEELFVRFKIISAKGFPREIESKICTLQASHDEA